MSYQLSADQMTAFYRALSAKAPTRSRSFSERSIQMITQTGWEYASIIEDQIVLCDTRLGRADACINLREFGRSLALQPRWVCDRPLARSSNALFMEAWCASDIAYLSIALEKLGFRIDPSRLVEEIRRKIIGKRITHAEFEVLMYGRQRHKSKIVLEQREAQGDISAYQEHKMITGHKALVLLGVDNVVLQMSVYGPRFRRQRPPVERLCEVCGHRWFQGDPDSSYEHRRIHKKRMLYLEPKPHDRMVAEMARHADYEHVDWKSPKWKHREMYERAVAFKREEGYDFTQWDMPETDQDAHGFLFTNPDGRIAGACAFRLRDYTSGRKAFALQWVWIAPRYRRHGILSARWNNLRRRFGAFQIETPISNAMEAFIAKINDRHLTEHHHLNDIDH